MKGYIYILYNPAMEGLVKIGKTTRSASERAKEIKSGTGLPDDFRVVYEAAVSNCDEAEKQVHAALRGFRYKDNREFFTIPVKDASTTVQNILLQEQLLDTNNTAASGNDVLNSYTFNAQRYTNPLALVEHIIRGNLATWEEVLLHHQGGYLQAWLKKRTDAHALVQWDKSMQLYPSDKASQLLYWITLLVTDPLDVFGSQKHFIDNMVGQNSLLNYFLKQGKADIISKWIAATDTGISGNITWVNTHDPKWNNTERIEAFWRIFQNSHSYIGSFSRLTWDSIPYAITKKELSEIHEKLPWGLFNNQEIAIWKQPEPSNIKFQNLFTEYNNSYYNREEQSFKSRNNIGYNSYAVAGMITSMKKEDSYCLCEGIFIAFRHSRSCEIGDIRHNSIDIHIIKDSIKYRKHDEFQIHDLKTNEYSVFYRKKSSQFTKVDFLYVLVNKLHNKFTRELFEKQYKTKISTIIEIIRTNFDEADFLETRTGNDYISELEGFESISEDVYQAALEYIKEYEPSDELDYLLIKIGINNPTLRKVVDNRAELTLIKNKEKNDLRLVESREKIGISESIYQKVLKWDIIKTYNFTAKQIACINLGEGTAALKKIIDGIENGTILTFIESREKIGISESIYQKILKLNIKQSYNFTEQEETCISLGEGTPQLKRIIDGIENGTILTRLKSREKAGISEGVYQKVLDNRYNYILTKEQQVCIWCGVGTPELKQIINSVENDTILTPSKTRQKVGISEYIYKVLLDNRYKYKFTEEQWNCIQLGLGTPELKQIVDNLENGNTLTSAEIELKTRIQSIKKMGLVSVKQDRYLLIMCIICVISIGIFIMMYVYPDKYSLTLVAMVCFISVIANIYLSIPHRKLKQLHAQLEKSHTALWYLDEFYGSYTSKLDRFAKEINSSYSNDYSYDQYPYHSYFYKNKEFAFSFCKVFLINMLENINTKSIDGYTKKGRKYKLLRASIAIPFLLFAFAVYKYKYMS